MESSKSLLTLEHLDDRLRKILAEDVTASGKTELQRGAALAEELQGLVSLDLPALASDHETARSTLLRETLAKSLADTLDVLASLSADEKQGSSSEYEACVNGMKTVFNTVLDVCDSIGSAGKSVYGRHFLGRLLTMLCQTGVTHSLLLRQIAQVLLALIQGSRLNQKSIVEQVLSSSKEEDRSVASGTCPFWNCIQQCGDLLTQLDLLEILYRCGRDQYLSGNPIAVLSLPGLSGTESAKHLEQLISKRGQITSSAAHLAEELHLLAEVVNRSLGDASCVQSFRPLASTFREFQHPDVTAEQALLVGTAEKHIFSLNANSFLFTFVTSTDPVECVEVDIDHHDVEGVTIAPQSAQMPSGIAVTNGAACGYKATVRLRDLPLMASDSSSIRSPGTGCAGTLEMWFSAEDSTALRGLLPQRLTSIDETQDSSGLQHTCRRVSIAILRQTRATTRPKEFGSLRFHTTAHTVDHGQMFSQEDAASPEYPQAKAGGQCGIGTRSRDEDEDGAIDMPVGKEDQVEGDASSALPQIGKPRYPERQLIISETETPLPVERHQGVPQESIPITVQSGAGDPADEQKHRNDAKSENKSALENENEAESNGNGTHERKNTCDAGGEERMLPHDSQRRLTRAMRRRLQEAATGGSKKITGPHKEKDSQVDTCNGRSDSSQSGMSDTIEGDPGFSQQFARSNGAQYRQTAATSPMSVSPVPKQVTRQAKPAGTPKRSRGILQKLSPQKTAIPGAATATINLPSDPSSRTSGEKWPSPPKHMEMPERSPQDSVQPHLLSSQGNKTQDGTKTSRLTLQPKREPNEDLPRAWKDTAQQRGQKQNGQKRKAFLLPEIDHATLSRPQDQPLKAAPMFGLTREDGITSLQANRSKIPKAEREEEKPTLLPTLDDLFGRKETPHVPPRHPAGMEDSAKAKHGRPHPGNGIGDSPTLFSGITLSEESDNDELEALNTAISRLLSARRERAARRKEGVIKSLHAEFEAGKAEFEKKAKNMQQQTKAEIEEEFDALSAELSGIAKSIAGAKSDFEATVRRLWDSYVVAYQRLKDLSKSAEGRIRKLQEGATRESRDLQTRLDKSIAAGQESFAEAERLGSSAQLAQLLSVPSD